MIKIHTQRLATDLRFRLWALAVLLGLLSTCVAKGCLDSFDQYIFRIMADMRSYGFDALFRAISFFGSCTWLILGLIILSVYEWKKAGRNAVLLLLGAFSVSFILEIILRFSVGRMRPDIPLAWQGANLFERFEAFGFPSGHGLRSAFIFGWIVMLGATKNSRSILSLALDQFCIFMIFMVGISRLYLYRHWPSDILGSWLLVAAVFTVVSLWRAGMKSVQEKV